MEGPPGSVDGRPAFTVPAGRYRFTSGSHRVRERWQESTDFYCGVAISLYPTPHARMRGSPLPRGGVGFGVLSGEPFGNLESAECSPLDRRGGNVAGSTRHASPGGRSHTSLGSRVSLAPLQARSPVPGAHSAVREFQSRRSRRGDRSPGPRVPRDFGQPSRVLRGGTLGARWTRHVAGSRLVSGARSARETPVPRVLAPLHGATPTGVQVSPRCVSVARTQSCGVRARPIGLGAGSRGSSKSELAHLGRAGLQSAPRCRLTEAVIAGEGGEEVMYPRM